MKIIKILLILLVLSPTILLAQSGLYFFVSPIGNDNWPGNELKPFKTIGKAQAAVRKALQTTPEDITVFIREGEYFIDKTLVFNGLDNGNNNQKVSYKAYNDETPVLSGGKQITDWTLFKNGIYKTNVKDLSFRQLYVNSKRAIRARQPNVGDYHRLTGWDIKGRNLLIIGNLVQQWENFEHVEAVIQMFWSESFIHLKSFEKFGGAKGPIAYVALHDEEASILFPRPYPQKQDDAVFHFENALEFVDQAGEWYLNPVTSELYYKPHPSTDIHKTQIIVPVTETLVRFEGSPDNPVANISFEGLRFEYSNWDLPSRNGFINGQAGMYNTKADEQNNQFVKRPSAAILLKNAKNIRFTGNLFQNMGATAIDLVEGTNQCKIVGNVIRSIAGSGVMIGAFTNGPNAEFHIPYNPVDKHEICTDDEISNNYIYEVARDYIGTCPVAAGYPAGLKITHNKIFNAPYCGISLGFGWTSKPNAMRDNVVANNEIFDVMNLLCDGGAIYTLSLQPGTIIRENYIHDIKRSPWAGAWPIASMYHDEATGGTDEKPMVIERNSLPTSDKTIKQWSLHVEGQIYLKNNSVYRIEEVAKKAGVIPEYKVNIMKILED
jgi:hypothetical protein